MYERDGRTDRHRMTALAALLHNIARQKLEISAAQWADVALDLEVLYLFTDVSGYIMGGSPPMCLCLWVAIEWHRSFLIQFHLTTASEQQCTSYNMLQRWTLIQHALALQVRRLLLCSAQRRCKGSCHARQMFVSNTCVICCDDGTMQTANFYRLPWRYLSNAASVKRHLRHGNVNASTHAWAVTFAGLYSSYSPGCVVFINGVCTYEGSFHFFDQSFAQRFAES